MRQWSVGAVALLVLVTILSIAIVPVGTATAQSDTAVNATLLDYGDLNPEGKKPEHAPSSVRAAGTYSEYALKTLPTGIWVQSGSDSPWWQYLRQGATIQRNKVQLWSKRGYGLEPKNVTIWVAYWQEGRRTVTRNNATQTEPAATNVTIQSIDSQLSGGYDYVTLDLKPHFDQRYELTVCVQEEGAPNCLETPGTLRWRATHHSSRIAMPAGVSSAGDKVAWGLGIILLPFLASTIISMVATRRAVEEAYSKPEIGVWKWIVMILVSLVLLIALWDYIVNTVIVAPYTVPVLAGMMMGLAAAMLFGDRTFGTLFLRLRTTDWSDSTIGEDRQHQETSTKSSTDPTDHRGGIRGKIRSGFDWLLGGADVEDYEGEHHPDAKPGDAPAVVTADTIPIRTARGEKGTRHAVAEGLWSWVARARGATSDFEATEGSIRTRVDVDMGPYEELYFLDPTADEGEVLRHRKESHSWGFPEIVTTDENGNRQYNLRPLLAGGLVIGLSWAAGGVLFNSPQLGILVGGGLMAVWKVAKPTKGYLKAALAPTHYNSAIATVLQNARAFGHAMTTEDLFDALTESETEKAMIQQELQERGSVSQLDAIAEDYLPNGQDDSAPRAGPTPEEGEADD